MNQNLPLFAVTRHIAMVRLAPPCRPPPPPAGAYDVLPYTAHPSRRWLGCRVYTPLTSGVPAPETVIVSAVPSRRPDWFRPLPPSLAEEGTGMMGREARRASAADSGDGDEAAEEGAADDRPLADDLPLADDANDGAFVFLVLLPSGTDALS